ncbi:UDP-3-O-(3-hydroxymyristoyl)glucosamine N-acyltransferase [Caulobacter segnis]|uniref:UDP-3-O-(3-hydroxymyristoyl)glucosamine N-acyltransferase n=1 Tax=Caulobacter segnis TaxID=88688 RepID=UPI002410600E|nr:UDP-3-O-(3-hydroxymyristoyl)glucosamine N-acyltransferase [Caulobacter segnis]MDG2522030.1 UDP-3-O-(3-hydroxymyristoyl)glucosamine N-acyltransferase [Caulobacter segnis]
MPDPRFYEDLGPATLSELARLTGGQLLSSERADLAIRSVAPLARADADSIGFFSDKRYVADLKATKAGACFVTQAVAGDVPEGCAAVVVDRPQVAWAAAANRLHRARRFETGVQAVDPTARLEEGVLVSPGVVIGADVQIGRGTRIGPGVVIGPGVTIGRDCEISARAVIGFAMIGDRVRIYAGAVIGEAGFGATVSASGIIDLPQLGRVLLQDNVTLGANCCIDRGAYDDTVVGENTKIDNLVHIAHNVRIGRNCLLAAYTGISGSTIVGDGVSMGGQAGVADHLVIGDGARIGAAAGVMKNVPAGETWGGFPAQPIRQWLRETAWLARMAAGRKSGGVE